MDDGGFRCFQLQMGSTNSVDGRTDGTEDLSAFPVCRDVRCLNTLHVIR